MKIKPAIERFEEKVEVIPDGCHVWMASLNSTGYGNFRFDGKMALAHRVSYMLYVNQIPNNLHVLHKCDNPCCVNPDHLFLGTQADNNNDCINKGRKSWQNQTHCKRGHEFTEENTYRWNGSRHCLKCNKERNFNFRIKNGGKPKQEVTHCPQGHEYTEENTYTWKRHRACRICSRKRAIEWHRNKKAKKK